MKIEHAGKFEFMTAGKYCDQNVVVEIDQALAKPIGVTVDQSTPSISVNSTGLITATVASKFGPDPSIQLIREGYFDANSIGVPTSVRLNASNNTKQLEVQPTATITPTTSAQTAVEAGKYTTGAVTVAAMPVGEMGIVSAVKGTVSANSITVTPSISVGTAGYNAMNAKSGDAVTVTASELVSGDKTVTANGTVDVTNYASVTVAIPQYTDLS